MGTRGIGGSCSGARRLGLVPAGLLLLTTVLGSIALAGGVEVPAPGDLVLFDSGARTLYRFDPQTGEVALSRAVPQVVGGSAIAIDGGGRIVLVDRAGGQLWRLDSGLGEPAPLLPVPGAASLLVAPTDVFFDDDGSLLVTDAGPSATGTDGSVLRLVPVLRFVEGEGLVARWSHEVVETGLREPRALTVDGAGVLWVADAGDFESTGTPGSVYQIDPAGDGPVDFLPSIGLEQPVGIAVARDGTILVLDLRPGSNKSRLVRFDPGVPDQAELCSLPGSVSPLQMSVDSNGDLIVGRASNSGSSSSLVRVDLPDSGLASCEPEEVAITGVVPIPDVDDLANFPFLMAGDILLTASVASASVAADGQGEPGRVLRLRPSANVEPVVEIATQLDVPVDVAHDRLGQVLVMDQSELSLKRVDPASGSTVVVSEGGCMTHPEAITIDQREGVLAFDPPSGCGSVYRIDAGDGTQELIQEGCLAGSPFREPIDIAEDSDGELVFGQLTFGSVSAPDYAVLDRNARGQGPGIIAVDGDTLTQRLYASEGLHVPVRLTVHRGDVFVADLAADDGSPAILRAVQNGTAVVRATGFTSPITDLAVVELDGEERLVVSTEEEVWLMDADLLDPPAGPIEVTAPERVLWTLPNAGRRPVALAPTVGGCGMVQSGVPDAFAIVDAASSPSVTCTYLDLLLPPSPSVSGSLQFEGLPLVNPTDIASRGERLYDIADSDVGGIFTLDEGQLTGPVDDDGLLVAPQALTTGADRFWVADPGVPTLVEIQRSGPDGRLCADGSVERPATVALQPAPRGPRDSTSTAIAGRLPAAARSRAASTRAERANEGIQLAALGPLASPAATEAAPVRDRPPPDGTFCEKSTGHHFTARDQRVGVTRRGCADGFALSNPNELVHEGPPFVGLRFVVTNQRGDILLTDYSPAMPGRVWILRKSIEEDDWAAPEAFYPATPDPSFQPLAICTYASGEVNVSNIGGGSLEFLQIGRDGRELVNLTVEYGEPSGGISCVNTPVVGGAPVRRLEDLDVFPTRDDLAGACPEGDGAVTPEDARLTLAVALGVVPKFACDEARVDPVRLDVAPAELYDAASSPPQFVPGGNGEVDSFDALLIYRASLGVVVLRELP